MTTISNPSSTILPPSWRLPARIGWLIIAGSCLLILIVSTVELIQTPQPSCTESDPVCSFNVSLTQQDIEIAGEMGFPISLILLSLIFSVGARLSMALVGLIIFWRKSDDWVALFLSAALVTVLLEGVQLSGPLGTLTQFYFAIGSALFLPLPFIFPNGRFIPQQLRWIVIGLTIVYTVGYMFFLETPGFNTISAVVSLIWVILALYAIPYRYFRVSNAVERQQTKWVAFGLLALMVTSSYYIFFYSFFPPSQPSQARLIAELINLPLYLGGYLFFSFSMLMALLRYRLWDIDIIIRRTLQYGLVSTALALVYFGSVVVVQTFINGISGRDQPSQLSIALSTLLIAALFSPLRRRVQAFLDRRFYRRKYDAALTLAGFAHTARDEVDLDQLCTALHGVVEQTMQPQRMSVWIRPANGRNREKYSLSE